ncbi:MAG: RcnB family protein [Arenimonas sp.]
MLALTSALLLAGGAASSAFAQYYYEQPPVIVEGDPEHRFGAPLDSRYADYIRKNSRGRTVADKDCDGVPDRFDHHEPINARDRDCDGITNRYDHHDNPRYAVTTRYRSTSLYPVTTRYYAPTYVDYRPYGLSPPPYGYSWVRVDNDVYLVSTRDGLVAEVVYNLFR